MFKYKYLAQNMAGQKVKGTIEADSPEKATVQLSEQWLFVERINPIGGDDATHQNTPDSFDDDTPEKRDKKISSAWLILFAIVHLLCDFGWFAFVSVMVHRTKSMWGGKVQRGLLIASSLLLIGFGGWFLSSGIRLVV